RTRWARKHSFPALRVACPRRGSCATTGDPFTGLVKDAFTQAELGWRRGPSPPERRSDSAASTEVRRSRVIVGTPLGLLIFRLRHATAIRIGSHGEHNHAPSLQHSTAD